VVEADTLVPHRIPDGVGYGSDVTAPLVDEDHVEVALRAISAAWDWWRWVAMAAAIAVSGMVQESREPGVADLGQRVAEVVAVEICSLEELLAQRAERHERRYHWSPRTREGGAGVAWWCRR